METFLKQLEEFIGSMKDDDRTAAVMYLAGVITTLQKYPLKITAGAFLKFVSLLGIAQGTDGMERFKLKLKDRAKKVGPHVGALFQAL